MFTPGFKLFFGIAVAMATAAVVHGYTSGGTHLGPLSLGWKGGVGDHLGYGILVSLAVGSALIGLVLVAFRDADARAQAELLGVDRVASSPKVGGSPWPVIGAFGVATMAVGAVLNTAVFITGLAVVAVVAFEWLMDAWADRATGDPEANRALRDRVMAPLEIPALGAAIAAIAVLAVSRILLAVSANGAVIVAGAVAVLILATATIYAAKPELGRNLVAGLVLVIGIGVLAGGVISAAVGERDFEEHHEESEDHGEESEDHGEENGESGESDGSDEGSGAEAGED